MNIGQTQESIMKEKGGFMDNKNKKSKRYTIERRYLSKISSEELLQRIIKLQIEPNIDKVKTS